MFKDKKDIFFDLDHTLWDFEKNSYLAYQKIFSDLNIPVNLDKFIDFYIPTNFKYWKLFREEKINQKDLRYYRLKDVFDAINYFPNTKTIHQIADLYIAYLPTFNFLYNDALNLLNYLKPKYKLHIITNGFAEVQTKKLEHSGLNQFFETVTNSETAGVKKPNPKIFEFALKQANTNPISSLMIGDSLEADIQGAQAVGIETIYFNEFKTTHQTKTIEVVKLIEIKKYL